MYHHHHHYDDFHLETNSSSSDSQEFWNDYNIESFVNTHHEQPTKKSKRPLREKNSGKDGGYKHVPHREKPPQVVAKRNARERRRVQAVNNAFVKLRNVVPIQNTRGKRISKVKTLLYAIDYIRALDNILLECESYTSAYEMQMNQDTSNNPNYEPTSGHHHWNLEKADGFPSSKYFG